VGGVLPGYLWFPVALAADDEYLYVIEDDELDHIRVQVLRPDVTTRSLTGSLVAVFASERGAGPGEVWHAGGIAASPTGEILVSDAASNRIHVFKWAEPAVPNTPEPSPTESPTDPPQPTQPAEPTDAPTAMPTQVAPTITPSPPALDTPPPNRQPTPPEMIFLPNNLRSRN
jgi:hypothetical protein